MDDSDGDDDDNDHAVYRNTNRLLIHKGICEIWDIVRDWSAVSPVWPIMRLLLISSEIIQIEHITRKTEAVPIFPSSYITALFTQRGYYKTSPCKT